MNNSVDIEKRRKLSSFLRHLSTGQITNDDFENAIMEDVTHGWLPEQYFRSKESQLDDPVIQPIVERSWFLYSDLKNHYLKGDYTLSDFAQKQIARWILFLQSDQPYTWRYVDITNPVIRFSFMDILKSIFTLGYHYRKMTRLRKREFENLKNEGDFEYWPFKTKADYEIFLTTQPFLTGQKNKN